MVKIQINKFMASIQNGIWKCDNDAIERMLNGHITTENIDGYYPDMDYALAELAVKRLKAKIIEATDPPEYVEGRIY